MATQQAQLAWTGSRQHIRIVLKVYIGRELLGDHPLGVVDHKSVTNLVTGVGYAAVPNFAAKENTVSSSTEEALFLDTIQIGLKHLLPIHNARMVRAAT